MNLRKRRNIFAMNMVSVEYAGVEGGQIYRR